MRKMRFAVVVLLAAVIAGCGSGANNFIAPEAGVIVGNVYAASYNSGVAARTAGAPAGMVAVAGATVTAVEINKSTTTDSNGYFSIADVRPGATTLTITKAGMETLTVTVNVPEGGTANANTQNSNDTMTMAPSDTGTLIVTATGGTGAFAVPITGATVYIDGVATSKTTPATITDLAPKDPTAPGYTPYMVTVKLSGYNDPLPQQVAITTSSPNATVNFNLTPTDGNNAPYAVIALPTSNQSFNSGTTVTFTGTGTDPEDGNLSGTSLVWSSNRDGQLGTGTMLQSSSLSVGQHTITLTVTDSAGKTGTATVSITVVDASTTNTAPTSTVFTPTNNSNYTTAQTITFTGAGADNEDGALTGTSLAWTSSRDGNLGTGAMLQKTGLSVGTHTITLTVTDSRGTTGTDSVVITVTQSTVTNTAPTATIATPTDGATATTNTRITFSGAGTDAQDGAITGTSLVWRSNRDGQLGTGALFQRTLTAGTHTITLTATDSGGLTNSTSVSVVVSSGGANTNPVAVITSPLDGATGTTNVTFTFSGTGIDTEDGNLSGTSLVWTSSRDGQLGTGNIFTKKLSAGTHTITLTATDAQGGTGSSSISVVISGTNTAPTATILTPIAGLPQSSTTAITFSGAGTDAEDGTLTGASLVWRSNISGQIGTGNVFQASLPTGTHTITLTVTDSNGTTGTATRTVTVN